MLSIKTVKPAMPPKPRLGKTAYVGRCGEHLLCLVLLAVPRLKMKQREYRPGMAALNRRVREQDGTDRLGSDGARRYLQSSGRGVTAKA